MIINLIKKWRNKSPVKKIENLKIYDDVFLVKNNILYDAWIIGKTENKIDVCFQTIEFSDIEFDISNQKDQKSIILDNIKLFLIKDDALKYLKNH